MARFAKFRRLSFRDWLTLITLGLIVLVIFFGWDEIVKAWNLLDKVNIWILLLLIPVQFFSYYITGILIFSYLRAKGDLKTMSHWRMTRLALELNFVNHIIPSGGAAGFSYLSWILNHHGVSVSRSTMSQIVRFVLTFISFVMLLVIAMLILTFNHQIDRLMVTIGLALIAAAVGATILLIWLIGSKRRMERFSDWLTRLANGFVRWITRGKRHEIVKEEPILGFFRGIHDDYLAIRKDKRILIKPYLWATLGNISDVTLTWIAFWALGFNLDPALLFVAFGVASILSAISVTPGGAGVYEAVMITFLAASGVSADVAIAGTLLARVTLVLGTLLSGYFFYQLTINKYGKRSPNS